MTMPDGYRIERDSDALVLRTDDGTSVAAFVVRGATEANVLEAAWRHYREAWVDRQGGLRPDIPWG